MASGSLTWPFVSILLVSAAGFLLFGFHLAELNAPQAIITCKIQSIREPEDSWLGLPQCIPMTPAQFGFVSSVFTIGGLIGSLIGGSVSARFGRRKGMLFGTAFYIVGGSIETTAYNVASFSIGRSLSGIGAGVALVIVPIFIAETAPPAHRGFYGATTQVMINSGLVVAQVLGYILSRDSLWRIILAIGAAVGVVQLFALLLAGQESPRWIAEQGDKTRATAILQRLRGPHANIEDEVRSWNNPDGDDALVAEQETLLATDGLEASPIANGPRAKGLLTVALDPRSRAAVFGVIMTHAGQQLTGINAVIMYGVGLLSDLLGGNAALLAIGVTVLNLAMCVICAPLLDKWGRKRCILLSITGMGTASLILAVAISRSLAVLSAIAVLSFVASFAVGLGTVPFILATELVSADAMASTQSWALSSNFVFTFVIAQFFPILNERLHGKIFLLFTAAAVFFGLFIAWWIPETLGKNDADEVWSRKKPSVRAD